jgi:hypothetical protein
MEDLEVHCTCTTATEEVRLLLLTHQNLYQIHRLVGLVLNDSIQGELPD